MAESLLLSLKLSVLVLVFAIGMDSKLSDLAYLWRRPALLLRSLLAMYLLVPLIALSMAKGLALPGEVKLALLVVAVSAGAPLLPRKLMNIGDGQYIFGLVVTSSLLAIVTVPAWVATLGPLFDRELIVRPIEVAAVIGKSFLVPLAVGIVIGWVWPVASPRIANILLQVASAVLGAAAVVLLAANWPVITAGGWVFVGSMMLLALLSIGVGHLLGGPVPTDRTGLAVACATRHIGVAVLVASTVPGPRISVLVGAYILASALVSIPYLKWRRRSGTGS